MFSSWNWTQWVISGYIALVAIGAPVARTIQIRRGVDGFGPWNDFWGKWSADVGVKIILVVILYFGGFWG